MVVVPRLFEVIRARMIKSVAKQGKLANWMLNQALRVGEKQYERRMGVLDRPVDLLLNKLFRPKIQQRFGGRMKALVRSEEHTSELQSLMRISYAVFCFT